MTSPRRSGLKADHDDDGERDDPRDQREREPVIAARCLGDAHEAEALRAQCHIGRSNGG
jgi:hypothetical protein